MKAPPHRPWILGHRGASTHAPENSLAAFERALVDGADGVELDVLLSRDGHPVVFHDGDLLRLGGDPRRIDELSLAELRTLRLNSGATIPTLGEALAVLTGARLINIELKVDAAVRARAGCPRARLAAAVAHAIACAGVGDRVIVSSFDRRALCAFLRLRTGVRTGFLFEGQGLGIRILRDFETRWLRPFAVHPEHILCTPSRVAAWHARGYAVAAWTVDEPARIRALTAMGVDVLICNDPGAALRML